MNKSTIAIILMVMGAGCVIISQTVINVKEHDGNSHYVVLFMGLALLTGGYLMWSKEKYDY